MKPYRLQAIGREQPAERLGRLWGEEQAGEVVHLGGGVHLRLVEVALQRMEPLAAHPAYAEFVAEWRRFVHGSAWLTLRADVALPLDTDPHAPWGIYPRLTVGGGFGWSG